jgi:hypothetical protein
MIINDKYSSNKSINEIGSHHISDSTSTFVKSPINGTNTTTSNLSTMRDTSGQYLINMRGDGKSPTTIKGIGIPTRNQKAISTNGN